MKKRTILPCTLALALCCLLENAGAQDMSYSSQPPDSVVTLDVYLPFREGKSRVGKLADLRRQKPPVADRGLVCDVCPVWSNSTIPYQIEPGQFSPAYENMIHNAAAYVSDSTNLCVVQRTNEPNYISIVASSGCWSYVGMNGGVQQLGLNDITDGYGCPFGSIVHEFSHAAGLWHEQSREDRDEHVFILWDNIDPDYVHNFDQHITDGQDVGPYNFVSIMHYGPYAFSINGKPTIVRRDCSTNLGSTGQYTPGDIEAVGFLYPLPCECSGGGTANFGDTDRALLARLSRFISGELHGNYKILERAYIRHQREINRALASDDPKYRNLHAAFETLKARLAKALIDALVLEKENAVSAEDLAAWKHFLHELGNAVGAEDFRTDMQRVSRLFDVAAGKDLKSGLIAFDRASESTLMTATEAAALSSLQPALTGNPGIVTTLWNELPYAGRVEIALFDGNGAQRQILFDGFAERGSYTQEIDKRELPPGMYFIRCALSGTAGRLRSTQKMIVL